MFTSLDFLYLVIAFCILIFTGFLIWIMYYLAMILRQGNEMITDFRKKLEEIEEAIMNIKEKVVSSANSVSFLVKELGNLSKLIKNLKSSKKKTTKNSLEE